MTQRIKHLVAEKAFLLDCLVNKFPTGIFSYVMDSYDFYGVLDKVLPTIKDEIMQREGKFVVRGDSGDPVDVICGSFTVQPDYVFETEEQAKASIRDWAWHDFDEEIEEGTHCTEIVYHALIAGQHAEVLVKADIGSEVGGYTGNDHLCIEKVHKPEITYIDRNVEQKGTIERLWEIFGGTTNELGYKVLDEHIGMIYGDGITLERQQQILERLEAKGFASTNIVFGVGSYSLNLVSRDHLGMAIKATNAVVEVNGETVDKPIYKDPKTDSTKKSARGLLHVETEGNRVVAWKDCVTRLEESQGALRVIYMEGKHYNLETLFTIRERLWS